MLADRPEARMLAQALDALPDRGVSAPCPRPRSWLDQPDCGFLEVGERLGCVTEIKSGSIEAFLAGVSEFMGAIQPLMEYASIFTKFAE
jgi:hypothetical protein